MLEYRHAEIVIDEALMIPESLKGKYYTAKVEREEDFA
jgi:hypothetical protein